MADTKTLTLRLDSERADAVTTIAQANDTSVSETLREAIDNMIDRARGDKDFQARLQASIERNKQVLERLSH